MTITITGTRIELERRDWDSPGLGHYTTYELHVKGPLGPCDISIELPAGALEAAAAKMETSVLSREHLAETQARCLSPDAAELVRKGWVLSAAGVAAEK